MSVEPPPALPAASLILLREGASALASGLQALMGERPAAATAFPGAWVFPGGRIEAQDQAMAGGDPLHTARIAAIRETFEETGVLLAERADGRPATASLVELAQARLAMERGELDFAALLERLEARPALEALVPAARLIAPPERPRRFDTWFFLAEALEPDPALIPTTELTRVEWVGVGEMLGTAARQGRLLHPPTLRMLSGLAAHDTVAAALAAAREVRVEAVQL